MDIKNKVVKVKKLQTQGGNYSILIPKFWVDELNWCQETELTLEFLPNRKTIIISENEETGNIITV